MKLSFKRIISLTLVLVMVLAMAPMMALQANAATTTDFADSTVADLGISATNATGSGTPECMHLPEVHPYR